MDLQTLSFLDPDKKKLSCSNSRYNGHRSASFNINFEWSQIIMYHSPSFSLRLCLRTFKTVFKVFLCFLITKGHSNVAHQFSILGDKVVLEYHLCRLLRGTKAVQNSIFVMILGMLTYDKWTFWFPLTWSFLVTIMMYVRWISSIDFMIFVLL